MATIASVGYTRRKDKHWRDGLDETARVVDVPGWQAYAPVIDRYDDRLLHGSTEHLHGTATAAAIALADDLRRRGAKLPHPEALDAMIARCREHDARQAA